MGAFHNVWGGRGIGRVPPPHKVLAGVRYGPSSAYTGTAPEAIRAVLPVLVRGDDYITELTQIKMIVADPGDLGALDQYLVVFAGYNIRHKTGWRVTDGVAVDLDHGLLELRSPLPSAATLACKPGCEYEWTHTLIDSEGRVRTQKYGVTRLIDGYAVERFEE